MSTTGDGTSTNPDGFPTGDRAPAINTVQALMISLSTLAVFLRFVARRIGGSRLWWDDWCILTSWIFALGCNITVLTATSQGLGKHLWQAQDGGHDFLRSFFILELLFTPALALNKLGVLLMYHRLFGVERSFQIWIRVLGGIVVAWWIGVEVATLLQCSPIDKFWQYQKPGYCVDLIILFAATALPNVIIDIVILLLPQPYIRNLNMSWPNKIALAAVFFLGSFTAITGVGRLTAVVAFNGGYDFSWSSYTAIIWFSLEPAIGIISACLPCLGPLLRKIPGSPFASHNQPCAVGMRSGLSQTNGSGQSYRGSRYRTESVTQLTEVGGSSKSSMRDSARLSQDGEDAWPGACELNTLAVKKSAQATTRKYS